MFSPESIAELVVLAAQDPPREMLIGWPTVQAVWAQKLVPGILDLYLGKYGYDSQLIDQPNAQRGDILYQTLPGDPGAHGPYRDQERGPDVVMRLLATATAVMALARRGRRHASAARRSMLRSMG